jgi:hypothetical protein
MLELFLLQYFEIVVLVEGIVVIALHICVSSAELVL